MKVLILTANATFYLATLDPLVELKCRSISTISQQLRGLKNSARKEEFKRVYGRQQGELLMKSWELKG